MRIVLAGLAALALSGCVTPEEEARREAAMAAEVEMERAAFRACNAGQEAACIFLRERAALRVARAQGAAAMAGAMIPPMRSQQLPPPTPMRRFDLPRQTMTNCRPDLAGGIRCTTF